MSEKFTITQAASDKLQSLMKSEQYFRVSVSGGGCSGFSYKFEIVDHVNNDDEIFEKNSVKTIIDDVSMEFLENSTLDYILEIGYAGFRIQNPNATANCGCGNSFSV